jgi:hypothetical protein
MGEEEGKGFGRIWSRSDLPMVAVGFNRFQPTDPNRHRIYCVA